MLISRNYWKVQVGFTLPTDLCYATTTKDDEHTEKPVKLNDHIIEWRGRAVGFKVLGTQITFDVHDDLKLWKRFKSAWGAFTNTKISYAVEPLLQRKVTPALFWGAGSWHLRSHKFTELRGLQWNMRRKMKTYRKHGTTKNRTRLRKTKKRPGHNICKNRCVKQMLFVHLTRVVVLLDRVWVQKWHICVFHIMLFMSHLCISHMSVLSLSLYVYSLPLYNNVN